METRRVQQQITADVATAAAKIAPPVATVAATYTPGYTLSDWAMICTILFTLAQLFSVTVKNWGEWTAWWTARWCNALDLLRWLRGVWRWIRGHR